MVQHILESSHRCRVALRLLPWLSLDRVFSPRV
jgi:hypothetical protein